MSDFSFAPTLIEGLYVVTPFFRRDKRGFFLKSFEREIFKLNGIDFSVSEDFESYSTKGVIRGLHFQTEQPQAKYVRVLIGCIYDVAVDLRSGSSTFGKWHAELLSEENRKGLLMPAGFAHGFQVLSDKALVSYKCDGVYSPETDTGIRWDDPDLAIDWPHKENVILSERDASFVVFADSDIGL